MKLFSNYILSFIQFLLPLPLQAGLLRKVFLPLLFCNLAESFVFYISLFLNKNELCWTAANTFRKPPKQISVSSDINIHIANCTKIPIY